MSKQKNIFESVQFIGGINEGIGFKLLELAVKMIVVPLKMMDNKIKKHAQLTLKNALNNNKNLTLLRNKLKKGTRVVSVNTLKNKVQISDNDIEIIKNNDISVLAMVDINDNIIAYCLLDANDRYRIRYGYVIVDKSLGGSKDIQMFIQATFEYKIGIYGDAIKYFTNKYKNIFSFSRSDTLDNDIDRTANYLSKDESNALLKIIKDLTNMVLNKTKLLFSDLIYDEENSIFDINGHNYITFYDNELMSKYNGYYDDVSDTDENKDKEITDRCKEKFKKFMNNIGFESSNNYSYTSKEDKYRNIMISFDSNGERFGSYEISIFTTRKLAE